MRIRSLISRVTTKTTLHIRTFKDRKELYIGYAIHIPKELLNKIVYQYHPVGNILVIDIGE